MNSKSYLVDTHHIIELIEKGDQEETLNQFFAVFNTATTKEGWDVKYIEKHSQIGLNAISRILENFTDINERDLIQIELIKSIFISYEIDRLSWINEDFEELADELKGIINQIPTRLNSILTMKGLNEKEKDLIFTRVGFSGFVHSFFRGDVNYGFLLLDLGLDYAEQNNDLDTLFWFMIVKAEVYMHQGKLDLALVLNEELIQRSEESKFYVRIGSAYGNIGEIFFQKGNQDKGEYFTRKALEYKLNLWGDLSPEFRYEHYSLSKAYFNLIRLLLRMGRKSSDLEIQNLLKDLQSLKSNLSIKKEQYKSSYDHVDLYVKLSEALILKLSKRTRDQAKAQELFDDLYQNHSLMFEQKIIVLKNITELLIDEFKHYNNPSVFTEIHSVLDTFHQLAINQKSNPILANTLIFKSKLSLIDGNIEKGNQYLVEAETIAEKSEVSYLIKKIQLERKLFGEEISSWKSLVDKSSTIQERLTKSNLINYLEQMLELYEHETDSAT